MKIFLLVLFSLFTTGVFASDDNDIIQTLAPELLSKSKAQRIDAINAIAASGAADGGVMGYLQEVI